MRILREFVDAILQSNNDLAFVETVLNDVWEVALDELATITDIDRCRKPKPWDKTARRRVPSALASLRFLVLSNTTCREYSVGERTSIHLHIYKLALW
jgi:hypothetical protein